MNLNKKSFIRTRKEAVVKFVDDESVPIVKNIDEFKTKNKNDESQQSQKSSSKVSASKTKEDKLDVKSIVDSIFIYSDNDDDDSSSSDEEKCPVDKPVALFQEGDVPGKAVFGFQTPKRKNAMVDKATESAERVTPSNKSTVGSPRTPSSGCKKYGFTPRVKKSIPLKLNANNTPETFAQKEEKKAVEIETGKKDFHKKKNAADLVTVERSVPKTPYSLRARLKTKIAAQVKREFEDFSDSEEDFVPSDDDNDDESCSSDSGTDVKSTPKQTVKNADKKENLKISCNTPLHKYKRKDLTYAITADEYFNSNSGKNNKTSNHTLNRLKNPRLAQHELDKLLCDVNQRCSHQSALETLKEECCTQDLFSRWCFCLREGYSLLLYGLGSKRLILNTFHQDVLSESHVLVINGFFPGLTIKEIIDSLAGELLKIKDVPSQSHEVIEMIEEKLNHRGSPRIFIIVHNLDGVMLRTDKAQALLARLASMPKCSLLASIDHINAPLLWDDKKLSEFNFLWEDVTNYNMYVAETSFENSLLVQRSGSLALASLKNVFQSLTKNGKEIFKILLKDCLANKKNQKYVGLGFSDLYWRCRDNFLVSTDLALRSQLTEFLDHQIAKWRKDSDHLIIPIDSSVLEQFQNLLQDAEF